MQFQAKDFMSKKIKSIKPEVNAKDAVRELISSGTSGLPVIDASGELVGVFTEKEILRAIMPAYVEDVGAFVYGEDSRAGLKKMAGLDKFLVRDLMRKDVPTVEEEVSLTEISRMMLAKSERRILVVRDKKPVGVITRHDVLGALAKGSGIIE